MAQTFWYNNQSGGINQYAAPNLLKDEQFELIVNASQSEYGGIAHRDGVDLIQQISASNPIRGLDRFNKTDGTHYAHAVHQGILYVSDTDGANFTSQENAAGTELATSSTVEFANFLGRHYFVGSATGEYLRYATETGASTKVTVISDTAAAGSTGSTLVATTTGTFNKGMVGLKIYNTTDTENRTITAYTNSTTVTVSSAINDTWDGDTIKIYMSGKYLASDGSYMLVAGGAELPLRVYWTNAQLLLDLTSQSFFVESDYANLDSPPTGVAAFGNGRPFVIFMSDSYLIVDPVSGRTNQVEGYGCSSHRSIKNLRGTLIWADRDKIYQLAHNQAFPSEISLPISNRYSRDAVTNKIAASYFDNIAAGTKDNKYIASLGDLSATVKGTTLDDCVIELDQDLNGWKTHTFTDSGLGTVFTTFIDSSGNEFLMAGSRDDGSIYEVFVEGIYTDDNNAGTTNAVTTTIITKRYVFGLREEIDLKNVKGIHLKYKSSGTITLTVAKDGSSTYDTFKTIPAASEYEWVYADYGQEAKSISLKFTSTSNFIIYAIGFEIEVTGVTGRKSI